jgi:threonine aldolase
MALKKPIDLRSDTVTQPTAGMRKAMAEAVVGDDVFGEDPTVNKLQERVAELLGKEAALFVPTGVMGNQLAIKALTEPGDEIIVEAGSHIFNYETAGPSLLSNVQLYTLQADRGILKASQLEAAIRPKAYYMPRTSLVCLENTHNRAGGTVYPLDEIKAIRSYTKQRGLSMHLDGARIWNASAATGISPKDYASQFDTVSVCFSKGLGAPVGSALAGSKELIERARKFRKIFGGGMRQAGIIAAGALYALDHHVERLHEDHSKARAFAERLVDLPGIAIDLHAVQTNIVIVELPRGGSPADEVLEALKSNGVLMTDAGYTTIRAVMHMDVNMEDVKEAAEIVRKVISSQ